MISNEYIINKILDLLKNRENNLFTGTISNPKLFSECNVLRDKDKTTIRAININCISPGKVIVVKDIDDNKYYCFTDIENSIASTKNILYRKTSPIIVSGGNYFKELLDLNNNLTNKKIKIGSKSINLNVKKTKPTKKINILKDNTLSKLEEDLNKFSSDYNLSEYKDYLVSYSDSCLTYNKTTTPTETNVNKYYSFIDPTNNKYELKSNINQQPVKNIDKNTKYFVTNFSPYTLFSFVSNKNTHPNTNLNSYFNSSITNLKRDKKNYNPNFYYVWRLIESGDGYLTYAYGWVNLDGQLQISGYNYELDPGCLLTTGFIFHSENDYDGYMRIDIGGMDRTNLIINRNDVFESPSVYKPTVLFPPTGYPRSFKYFGYTNIDSEIDTIAKVNNDILDLIN